MYRFCDAKQNKYMYNEILFCIFHFFSYSVFTVNHTYKFFWHENIAIFIKLKSWECLLEMQACFGSEPVDTKFAKVCVPIKALLVYMIYSRSWRSTDDYTDWPRWSVHSWLTKVYPGIHLTQDLHWQLKPQHK